ncbi:lytic polysaccharide monooxygenase [Actinomadura sp. ATCC 31491]|uniref:Lytic polysaccharide monooxygenase n=1 Tax=Actinomadura luzonensis TaxID=2805427 RepID=A0ABT0FNM3_9ACTN|nr:lytic polysaccharide monooxygenase [Actinomadura luzonensis]MCK2213768.1 lytic polysaccharide monooxygenase [Actinomadura luzonensis]
MRHRITSTAAGLTLSSALIAAPAMAHGALESPLSRAAACGGTKPPAACRAAAAVKGSVLPGGWDDLRIAGVAGRDRQVVPDGKLCSGGLPGFRGFDLPRDDWPATKLRPGARFTFRYRGTIPHKGTFRLYVTKPGYDPAKPLRWSSLEREPFLTVTDPKLADGSYVFKGRLPTGRTGRHLIYTIWQNSDTPDTYYSCSDVVFTRAPGAANAPALQPPARGPAAPAGPPWQLGVTALLVAGAGTAAFAAYRAGRGRGRAVSLD